MPRKFLSTGDRLAAKKDLSRFCPFCKYESRSDHVRRHIQLNHPNIKDVVGELPSGKTYTVLDAQHPNIVISAAMGGDCYYKHQAYCYGCHHRILCLSKVLDKAVLECHSHECIEKQVRSTSKSPEGSVRSASSSSIDIVKKHLELMAAKSSLMKEYIDTAMECADGDYEEVFESVIGSLSSVLTKTEKANKLIEQLAEENTKLKSAQTAPTPKIDTPQPNRHP